MIAVSDRRASLAFATLIGLEVSLIAAACLGAFGLMSDLWSLTFFAYLAPPPRLSLGLATGAVALVTLFLMRSEEARTLSMSSGVRVAALAALGLWLACLLLPDRSGFLGDFLLRLGALRQGDYSRVFQQGLPLDHLIIGRLLPWIGPSTGIGIPGTARLLGLLAYGSLLAIAFAWLRRKRTAPALGVILLCGNGIASLFTGFARDTVVLLPLCLAYCVALDERVEGRTHLRPIVELLLLALLATHRSSLLLVVPYLYATIRAWRRRTNAPALAWKAALGVFLLGALALTPRYARVLTSFDISRHADWLQTANPARLPMLDPSHLLDVTLALSLLAPASFLSILALVSPRRASDRLGLTLIACWLPLFLLVRPQQGVLRDYDVYAPAALVCAFAGLRELMAADRERRRVIVLGRVAGLASLLMMAGSLLVAHSPKATRLRVQAALKQGATGPAPLRAQWLDFLFQDAEKSGDDAEAARLALASAEVVPTPLRLVRAGVAAAEAGDYEASRTAFARLALEQPTSVVAWLGIAGTSAALGDTVNADTALDRAHRLRARGVSAAAGKRFLLRSPQVDPTGLARGAFLEDR